MAGKDNLRSLADLTTEEQREIARKGGQASVRARREKKLMTDIYAKVLADKYKVKNVNGEEEEVGSDVFIGDVIKSILAKKNHNSVQLIKELREAMEGSTVVNINEEADEDVREFIDSIRKLRSASKNSGEADS